MLGAEGIKIKEKVKLMFCLQSGSEGKCVRNEVELGPKKSNNEGLVESNKGGQN